MINNQQLKELDHDLKDTRGKVNDLVCFSHLRWDFVYQRPQHLMSRFAKLYRVFFIEEPVFHDGPDTLDILLSEENVWIVKPCLDNKADEISIHTRQKYLLNQFFEEREIKNFITWYYTPMALKISSHLKPALVIYDCMDELSAFKFAPAELRILETELFKKADLVLTGGHCLYNAKRNAHHNIHPFPSSIDKEHFLQARKNLPQPADQEKIKGIRFGYYGVIDERFNIKLVEEVATKRPEWQLVLVGPVIKIDPADLPKRDNIHYLGGKNYSELPTYLSGWDFAIIPFEKNESTKFISPTKTPEYLAGGKPVISTSITDVVTPYGENNLVYIADAADDFIAAAEYELGRSKSDFDEWLAKVDKYLKNISWDSTHAQILKLVNAALAQPVQGGVSEGLKSVA